MLPNPDQSRTALSLWVQLVNFLPLYPSIPPSQLLVCLSQRHNHWRQRINKGGEKKGLTCMDERGDILATVCKSSRIFSLSLPGNHVQLLLLKMKYWKWDTKLHHCCCAFQRFQWKHTHSGRLWDLYIQFLQTLMASCLQQEKQESHPPVDSAFFKTSLTYLQRPYNKLFLVHSCLLYTLRL